MRFLKAMVLLAMACMIFRAGFAEGQNSEVRRQAKVENERKP